MFCFKCGKEISETAKFCPHCGEGMNDSLQSKPVKEKKPVNKKKVAIISSVAAVLAVVIGLGIYCILNPSPESVVKDFMKALEDGDYKAMGELFNEDFVRYQVEAQYDIDIDDYLEDDLEDWYELNPEFEYEISDSISMKDSCKLLEDDLYTYYTGEYGGDWEMGDKNVANGNIKNCTLVFAGGKIETPEEDIPFMMFFILAKTNSDNKWGIIDYGSDDF